MGRLVVWAAGCWLAMGIAYAGQPVAKDPVMPLTAKVEGEGYEQLSIRWWRWANSFPYDFAPYRDPDGRLCDMGQNGAVWFLAGTDGRDWVQRRCVVPKDKHVFLPIINMYQRSSGPVAASQRKVMCDSLRDSIGVNNSSLSSAQVLVDGVPVSRPERFRVTTPACFDPFPQEDGKNSGYVAASDGYWVLLPPLSPGRHTIMIGANYRNQDGESIDEMLQNFEYVLEVGGQSI